MDHLQEMLRNQPHQPSALDTIRRCIEACFDCAQTCTLCADSCLAEENVAELRYCIRLNLDCADICGATGRIVSRLTKPNRSLMEAALNACADACRACAEECERHANMHAHCKVCAAACRGCEPACQGLLAAMP